MQQNAPYAWQQLTELVALAIGVNATYNEVQEAYYEYDGAVVTRFDPVRNDGEAVRLARREDISVKMRDNYVIASPESHVEISALEWDSMNDGDSMKSYRLAVCRAVLLKYEAIKAGV